MPVLQLLVGLPQEQPDWPTRLELLVDLLVLRLLHPCVKNLSTCFELA